MTDASCVVCDQPTDGGCRLCSRRCLRQAQVELTDNLDRIRDLQRRNSFLTSAIIGWRPDPPR